MDDDPDEIDFASLEFWYEYANSEHINNAYLKAKKLIDEGRSIKLYWRKDLSWEIHEDKSHK